MKKALEKPKPTFDWDDLDSCFAKPDDVPDRHFTVADYERDHPDLSYHSVRSRIRKLVTMGALKTGLVRVNRVGDGHRALVRCYWRP